MSRRWLRGPALEILVKFGELQVGDEVKIAHFEGDDQHLPWNKTDLARVWFFHSDDGNPAHPINLSIDNPPKPDRADWDECCCAKHIIAWRRPK